MPQTRQGRPRPERHTPPPPNPPRPRRADPRGMPEGRPGGGPPRPHTQGKPPAKILTTPHPSPHSRAPPCLQQPPPTTLHRCVQKKKKGNISQGYSILLSQNHQSQTSIEDAFFSGSGLADKKHFTVHVEHRFILFILFICFFFLNFCFISPFLFLHYVVVSTCESAQTTLKFIHSVQTAVWDKISLVCKAAGHCGKPPHWTMGQSVYNRLHLVWLS